MYLTSTNGAVCSSLVESTNLLLEPGSTTLLFSEKLVTGCGITRQLGSEINDFHLSKGILQIASDSGHTCPGSRGVDIYVKVK